MKKVLQIVAAAVLSVAALSVPANAADCDVLSINNTGTGSNNQVVCNVTRNVTVVCVNNVYTLDSNSQSAVSGDASSQGNTVTSGTVITGNATNTNGQNVIIGASCNENAAPVSPTPSVTPTTPGQGGVTPAAPKALPNTSANSMLSVVAVSLLVAAAIVAGSRLAVAAYRRIGSK